MYYCDSHIHFQDYKSQDVKNVISSAIQNKVELFINASSHPSDWGKISALTAKYPQIIPAYGVHPWYINEVKAKWAEILELTLQQNPAALVGECGIDRNKSSDIGAQIDILQTHINLANKYQRPLILHAVKANEQFAALFSVLPKRTIFHSFTGSLEWGREIQKRGFFIGLNFSILRKKNVKEIIKSLNLHQILLETDGPYQNIIPHTETLPQNLPDLANKIAVAADINLQDFQQILFANKQQFLGV